MTADKTGGVTVDEATDVTTDGRRDGDKMGGVTVDKAGVVKNDEAGGV